MNLFRRIESGTFDVVFMSACFFLLFTADMTILNMEKTIISSIHDDNDEFEVDGYDLLALLYITYGISLWLGPSAVTLIGLRTSMVIAAFFYTTNIAGFAVERIWAVYAATAIGGIGCGLLWTSEGKYLVSSSTPEVVSRNIGIFWSFFCASTFFGNLFAFIKLRGKKYIDAESRRWIIYTLIVISAIATAAFAFLRPVKKNKQEIEKTQASTPLTELKKTWKVFKTKEMLMLSVIFCFTGLQQAFNSGVYSPTIGFTLQFGNSSKELVPLSGIIVGFGQLLGGVWQIVVGNRFSKKTWGRRGVLMAGVISELISFSLIFINIPSSAVFGNTNDKAIIDSSIPIALISSLLLGIGDGFLNTQNFTIIAVLFPDASAQSCALYKFVKAVSVATGYFISSHFNLRYQLGIMTFFGITGLAAFIVADRTAIRIQNSTEEMDKKENMEIKP